MAYRPFGFSHRQPKKSHHIKDLIFQPRAGKLVQFSQTLEFFDKVDWAVTAFLNAILINFLPSHKQLTSSLSRVFGQEKQKQSTTQSVCSRSTFTHSKQLPNTASESYYRFSGGNDTVKCTSKLLDFCVCARWKYLMLVDSRSANTHIFSEWVSESVGSFADKYVCVCQTAFDLLLLLLLLFLHFLEVTTNPFFWTSVPEPFSTGSF